MRFDRALMLILAGAFSVFHVARALAMLSEFTDVGPVLLGAIAYLVVTAMSLIPDWGGRLPMGVALLNLGMAIALPLLVTSQLAPDQSTGYGSWHVAAVGTLMVVTLALGHPAIAWIGTAFLTVQSLLWCGLGLTLDMGVPGSVIWVAVATLLSGAMVRLRRDNARLAAAERETARVRAVQEAHRLERQERLRRTQKRSEPMLREIIRTGGELDEEARRECVLLEAGLRDEIRGRALLTDRVRRAVRSARRRGVEVQLLDEGTIDGMADAQHRRVTEAVAEAIDEMPEGRLIVRTAPRGGVTAVTVVGIVRDAATGEEEMVLGLSLPRFPEGADA